MSDLPCVTLDETNELTSDLELLGLTLEHAEAAMMLIDAATMPRLHAALLKLLAQLGYEIENVIQIGGC